MSDLSAEQKVAKTIDQYNHGLLTCGDVLRQMVRIARDAEESGEVILG